MSAHLPGAVSEGMPETRETDPRSAAVAETDLSTEAATAAALSAETATAVAEAPPAPAATPAAPVAAAALAPAGEPESAETAPPAGEVAVPSGEPGEVAEPASAGAEVGTETAGNGAAAEAEGNGADPEAAAAGVEGNGTGANGRDAVVELSEDAEFEQFFETYDPQVIENELIVGQIVQVRESEVVVDIGYKSEGIISIDEFRDVEGQVKVVPGDEVEVLVQRFDNRRGHLSLSFRKAQKMRVWNQIEDAFEKQTTVVGRVVERIRGGLEVEIGEIGVRGFLPGSQVDLRPVRNLGSYKGRELELRVIKLNKRRGNIVLSRRVVLEEEKEKTLAALEVGRVFRGEVRDLTEYGAFVDIGGICGLLHIREMSFRRLEHPSELMKVGDRIEVVILRFDAEAERVSLGYKQLNVDPWSTAGERYRISSKVRGKVVSITDYGAFIEMEPGVEGLIHVSEMSWSSRIKHPSRILSKGDFVEAMVLRMDLENRRISLGLKQVEPNPWPRLAEKYPIGSRLSGTVRKFTDFGAFVEVDSSIDGLIHISDLSWNKRVNHPSEVLKIGEKVETVVLSIDPDNRRLSLGRKQLSDDAWEGFFSRQQEGDVVDGTVIRFADFGAFVQIEEGIEGLLKLNDIAEPPPSKAEDALDLGTSYRLRIVRLSRDDRKVGLSLRATEGYEGQDLGAPGSVKIGDLWKR